MLRQFLLGGIVSLGNIAIHAMVMTLVVSTLRSALGWGHQRPRLWLTAVMVMTVGVLLVAHVAEVITWSLTYWIFGVAPAEANILYFALVNYTTLGYGDIVPVERWRLLGPMAAMNGILLFGWSTAVIFEVLRQAMQLQDGAEQVARDEKSKGPLDDPSNGPVIGSGGGT